MADPVMAAPAVSNVGPLAGIRIVVTRPSRQAAIFAQRLAILGAQPIICPAMVIAPPADADALDRALQRLDLFDFALFVSANAVDAVLQHAPQWPTALPAVAVGPTTADALIMGGVANVLVPPARFDSEGVLELPALQQVAGRRIAIFRGEGSDGTTGRELMRTTLTGRGAEVESVICYRRERPTFDVSGLIEMWRAGRVDAVVATSAEVLDNFRALIGDEGRALLEKTTLFVPHERIAAHAKAHNLGEVISTEPTDAGVLAGLLRHFRKT
jgi:uroporphyrinogen-III synthase